jgi:hypothetical protein
VTVASTGPATVENPTDVDVNGEASLPETNFVAETAGDGFDGVDGRAAGWVVGVTVARAAVGTETGVVEVDVCGIVVVVVLVVLVVVVVVVAGRRFGGSCLAGGSARAPSVEACVPACPSAAERSEWDAAGAWSAVTRGWFVVTRTAIATTTPAATTVPSTYSHAGRNGRLASLPSPCAFVAGAICGSSAAGTVPTRPRDMRTGVLSTPELSTISRATRKWCRDSRSFGSSGATSVATYDAQSSASARAA